VAVGLVESAAKGLIGVDRRVITELLKLPVPDLIQLAREQRPGDRIDVSDLFIDLFRHHKTPVEALPFYLDLIRSEPEEVSDEVVTAILRIGEPAVAPLIDLYHELGEEQGFDIAFVLARMGVRDPRIQEILLDRLEYDAAEGAFTLGLYGDPASRPALEKMLDEIPEEDVELRRELAFAIDQLNAPPAAIEPDEFDIFSEWPEKSLPVFDVLTEAERREMLRHEDSEVRAEAAANFASGEIPSVVKDELRVMIEDESRPAEERAGALVALAPERRWPGLIKEFYEKGGITRARAMEAMCRTGDSEFAEIFVKHLDDEDVEIARQAIWGVGQLGLGAQAEKLRGYFDNSDVRADALFSYAMCVPGETSRARARPLFRKIDALARLTEREAQLVMAALDERLAKRGLKPVFAAGDDEVEDTPTPANRVGRNDPCPCGSGKKFKKCCAP
jgi:HEAT repeat protein